MKGPLEHIRVLDLTIARAGPTAVRLLADWGADIVKIEPLTGDPARTFQQMLGGDMATNPVFEMDNRSKRSIALDLGTETGLEIAHELIAGADVFLTNVRLAGLDRLGLDHETLRTREPRLIYAAITGFGLEGPDADRAAYDIAAFWARSGLAHLLTPPGAFATYQFGTHTSRNQFCKTCGISPFRRARSDPNLVDVNVRCLEGVDADRLEARPFDGRNWEQAMRDRG